LAPSLAKAIPQVPSDIQRNQQRRPGGRYGIHHRHIMMSHGLVVDVVVDVFGYLWHCLDANH